MQPMLSSAGMEEDSAPDGGSSIPSAAKKCLENTFVEYPILILDIQDLNLDNRDIRVLESSKFVQNADNHICLSGATVSDNSVTTLCFILIPLVIWQTTRDYRTKISQKEYGQHRIGQGNLANHDITWYMAGFIRDVQWTYWHVLNQ